MNDRRSATPNRRATHRVLTAALRSVGGGRRAEAGESEAAAQTAGTKPRYPAGAHTRGSRDINTQTGDFDLGYLAAVHEKTWELTEGDDEMECNLKK